VFLNKKYKNGIPGSCQDAGYTWKQLDFQASVKPPPAEKLAKQAFL
jgi:hypothetical protein